MTSQINPADIDGNYPIAGVSNNTQGMRDNFTNTRTNFFYAAEEITDLQNNAVLKAALTGTTLDNNLANNVVYNAQIKGISGTVVAIANTSGIITIDCSAGHYQSINMAGNVSLSFTSNTWPTAGTLGMLRTQITVDQVGRTLTLPSTVSNGITGIQGYSSNVITFANTGTYEFGFSTTNAGNAITIFDLNRPLSYYTNDVTMAANLSVLGNITYTNVVGTTISAVGNITGGNLRTSGVVSAGGNIVLASGAAIGVGTTSPDTEVTILGYPQTTSYSLSGNSTTAGTDLHITGADSANTRITQDAFGTGVYVAFTGRTARGTAVTPTQTQNNDVLTQFTARGFSSGTLQFGNISTGRVDIVASENFTDTSRATKVLIYTTPSGTITPVNTATFDSTGGFTATANITGGNILSGAVVSAVGNATILSGTAVPAGGTTGAGYKFSSTTNLGVFFGSGAPTLTAAQGSLYLRTDGSTTSTRMYVNTNGSTTWTAVTTAA